MSILTVVDDLFFSVRIRETARQADVPVNLVCGNNVKAFLSRESEGLAPSAIIVDLNVKSAVDIIAMLKSNPLTRAAPVVGFASHVATDLIAAARAAGCDQVMARSAFTQQLPELLKRLATRMAAEQPDLAGVERSRF